MANSGDNRPAHELIRRPNTLPKTFGEKAREVIAKPGDSTVSRFARIFFGTIRGILYMERRLRAHKDVLTALEAVGEASHRLNTLGERLERRDELEAKRVAVQARQFDTEKVLLDNKLKEAELAGERLELEHELKAKELKAQLHKLERDAQPPPPPRPRPTEAEVAKERAKKFRQKGEDLLARGAAMAAEQQRLRRAVETMVKEGLLSPEVAEQILATLEDRMFQETLDE